MRTIKEIIIHCTATREGQDWTVEQIRRMHVRQNGWRDIGYHYVIYRDGTVHRGRPEGQAGAHTAGHNASSIGVCYVGGCDKDMRPKDTRTPAQRRALAGLVRELLARYPGASVHGHREFAAKACPCFDVARWAAEELAPAMCLTRAEGGRAKKKALLGAALLLCLLSSCRSTRLAERWTVSNTAARDTVTLTRTDTVWTSRVLRDSVAVYVRDTVWTDTGGTVHEVRVEREVRVVRETDEEFRRVREENERLRHEVAERSGGESVAERAVVKEYVWWPLAAAAGILFFTFSVIVMMGRGRAK